MEFIQKVVGSITKLDGTTNMEIGEESQNSEQFNLTFKYNGINTDINEIKDGYIPNIVIFPDGNTLIPQYDERSSNKLTLVKVKLSSEIMQYIKDYYRVHKNIK